MDLEGILQDDAHLEGGVERYLLLDADIQQSRADTWDVFVREVVKGRLPGGCRLDNSQGADTLAIMRTT